MWYVAQLTPNMVHEQGQNPGAGFLSLARVP